MTYEEILRELASLPPEGQKEVAEFISSLNERYSCPVATDSNGCNLSDLGFIGMWRDREDMHDSAAWVKNLREHEWGK